MYVYDYGGTKRFTFQSSAAHGSVEVGQCLCS